MGLSVPLAAPPPVFPALLSGTASREMTMFAFVYLSLTGTVCSQLFPTHNVPHHGIYALPHQDVTGRQLSDKGKLDMQW